MKILVVGGGGREHAIIRALKKSPRCSEIWCAPGNGGISYDAHCKAIPATDVDAMVKFAKEEAFDYVVVAQDDPLALGMVDALAAVGIPAFGPDKAAARIEASKVFSKDLMKKYGIPTAKYETFDDPEKVMDYIKAEGKYPVVIKADGLALGKGVLICQNEQEAADGVKEINLIAQDTTSYGVDLAGHSLLPDLLRKLVKIDGIRWIRLFYLYPHYFTDELMDLIVKEDKICPYVDLPLQHISQSVLKRMNRRDSEDDVRRLVKKLCSHGRKLTLRSTFIVGFPGETEEEFQELCDFVKETEFDDVGVFTYSQEDGTPAALMPDQIPEDVKEERYHQLMAIQAKVSEIRNQELEGSVHTLLVEKVEEEKGVRQAVGRIEIQAPDVDGLTYLEDADGVQPGDMIPVRIAQGFAYDLVAERLEQ